MSLVFQILLSVAHFVYSLYCFLIKHCESLLSSIDRRKFFNKQECDIFVDSENLIKSSKVPRHLAVILGHEKISILDLVKLISWCISAEIPYVSFYDYKGVLQENLGNFKQKLDELEPSVVQYVEWSSLPSSLNDDFRTITETMKPKTNGICTKNIISNTTNLTNRSKTKVQVLSYSDGKDKIINLTKNLANAVDLNVLQIKNIKPELINEKLSLNGRIPDPDLAITCGDTMCTYGFLPWQTRVTQFFILPSHHNISASIFYETLVNYSKCQQRYGK